MTHARSLSALAILLVALVLLRVTAPQPAPAPIPTKGSIDSGSERAELAVLRQYSRLDLKDMDPEALFPLQNALRELDPERTARLLAERRRLQMEHVPLDPFEVVVGLPPRAVWPVRRSGRACGWVVFRRNLFDYIPGTSQVELTLIDARGSAQAWVAFTTGWRRYVKTARPEPLPGFDGLVVFIDTWGLHGGDAVRQFYTVLGDRLDLVRLERGDGTATRNRYYVPHWTHGPTPPRQAAEGWEADLNSADRARVLRALVWLGGHHLLPLPPGQERSSDMEGEEEAELARAVRARPRVRARLRELAASGGSWEREMAGLALSPEDVRWSL